MASSGNFCIYNPLPYSTYFRTGLYSNAYNGVTNAGNTCANPGNACTGFGTMALTSGKKWYMEGIATNAYTTAMGIFELNNCNTIQNSLNTSYHNNTSYKSAFYAANGKKYIDGAESSYGATFAAGDVIGMAVDLESATNTVTFYKNNSSQGSFNLGTNGLDYLFCVARPTSSGAFHMNWGQDSTFAGTKTAGGNADANGFGDFFYSVPSGYLALCSGNLGMSADIDPAEGANPTQFHDTIIYTGDGGTATSITGLNFQPDWVLIKNRDQADGWLNQNSVSGVGVTHEWNDDGPYESETDCITAFNSDGFTLSNDHKVNANTEKYVAYCWKKSADAGFDIVEYSGNGSTNNVSHSLGATPDCIMMHLKSGSDWDSTMYFNSPSMGTGEGVFMTLANAGQTSTYVSAVSSSTFTPTTSANTSTRTYVAYLFRSIPGFSHFGEFEGNGNADGPFIYTGFRPKFIFFKAIDASENWQIRDTARQTYNDGTANRIYWNTNAAEGTASTASPIDFLTNGFKIRGSNTEINSNTIIYGAWGDVPFKYNNTF